MSASNSWTKPLTMEGLSADVGRAAPLVNYHLALINAQAGFTDAAAKNFKNAIDDPKNPPIARHGSAAGVSTKQNVSAGVAQAAGRSPPTAKPIRKV